ncbi:MAG: 3-deoxy-manno-octulosonate cytidylyltransferase [Hyphomicrobiaceae bacterium]
MPQTLVVIPARMAATRLPGKPLADIAGRPMIVHVWQRAMEAGVGRVVVATDTEDIAQAIQKAGGEAVLTHPDHPSGSDRVYEAINKVDPEGDVEVVVNLQGDLPTLDPALVSSVLEPLSGRHPPDIVTLAALIQDPKERDATHVVKVVGSPIPKTNRLNALYFTRAPAPHGEGPMYHHIGIYAYRRNALERFVALPPSYLETREKLEQLRALEDGMQIEVVIVDTVPLGVDTPADLERARRMLDAEGANSRGKSES